MEFTDLYERLVEVLGYRILLEEIVRAMRMDEGMDVLSYIARNHEVE